MNGLTFPGDTLSQLRRELLAVAPKEAAAILMASSSVSKDVIRLLVRESHIVRIGEYTLQASDRLELPPSVLVPLLKRARNEGLSLILAHTHPFSEYALFSNVDDEGEAVIMPALFLRAKNQPHGSLVLGQKECSARIYTSNKSGLSRIDVPVIEVGPEIKKFGLGEQLGDAFPAQFDRSVRAFGKAGQSTLAEMTVGVVGLGGIGSIVAEQLAHLGIGKFLLLDPDLIEETNLNRLVGANRKSIGRSKVVVAAQLIRRINNRASVRAIQGDVMDAAQANELRGVDFLFGCTDSHGSRTVINQLAYQYLIPAIDLGVRVQLHKGAIESVTGRVQMLAPGLPCLVCGNLLDAEEVRRDFLSDQARKQDPYIPGAAEPQPAVVSLNGAVASLGITMMLSAVVGVPVNSRHQIIRFDRGVVRSVAQSSEPNCIVCSTRGALGRGDTWPLPSRSC